MVVMMVVDTSAIIAILCNEPDAETFEKVFEETPVRLLSAASFLEASLVIEARYGEAGGRELDLLVTKSGLEIMPVTVEQAEVARVAFRRFGKGRHRAALNFGDCFSYALAKVTSEPLLFKGRDFVKTDVERVLKT